MKNLWDLITRGYTEADLERAEQVYAIGRRSTAGEIIRLTRREMRALLAYTQIIQEWGLL